MRLSLDLVDRGLWATPMLHSNDTGRAREDEWVLQLPALPPTSHNADSSVLGKQKQQRPSPPAYPHPQLGTGNQLPPIRNLVPGLWEPGTSKSSQRIPSDEGQSDSPVPSLRPIGPALGGIPMDANERPTLRPQFETNSHDIESNRDDCRRVNESKKRPPSSPIERAVHERSAPSNSVINSNRGSSNNIQTPPQVTKPAGKRADVRRRSSSEAARPAGDRRGSDPKVSHQQEILRDPHSALRQLLTARPMTINELQRGRSYGVSKRVLRGGS